MAGTSRWTQIPAEPASALRSVAKIRSSEAKLRTRIVAILALAGVAAAAGPIALGVALTRQDPVIDLYTAVPTGQGLATAVADAYLQGKPFLVPVADELQLGRSYSEPAPSGTTWTWDGYRSTYLEGRADRQMEVHHFLVTTPALREDGKPAVDNKGIPILVRSRLDVPVLLTPDGPVLATLPATLEAPEGTSISGGYESDRSVGDIPGLQASVDEWARAYAAGDGELLFRRSGAPASYQTLFRGLGGFMAESATITAITARDAEGDEYTVRVVVPLQAVDPVSGVQGPKQAAEYDLLIGGARSGNPTVSAWDAAGTGNYLTPYQNAGVPAPTPGP